MTTAESSPATPDEYDGRSCRSCSAAADTRRAVPPSCSRCSASHCWRRLRRDASIPLAASLGRGALLLASSLCLFAAAFRAPVRRAVDGRGWRAVSRLGLRSTTYRPGRSVLSISVVAAATFILISVDAFRATTSTSRKRTSSRGSAAMRCSSRPLLPIAHDPNTREGRQALNLGDLENVTLEPFRLRPGDDASCLNLYAPQNPRIVAPRDGFLDEGRFAFQQSLAVTDAERANPWLLLRREEPDGAVPVIADANSMTYVLHRRLGEDIVITHGGPSRFAFGSLQRFATASFRASC